MADTTVSVIVPVYNSEKTLSKCLDSLINQTFTNMEIIVVDDGSTDNSSEICDRYALHGNVIAIHQENKGVSVARNTGLEKACGQYIMFCDSDDWVEKDFVEVYCKYIEKSNTDMIVGGLIFNDLKSGRTKTISSVYDKEHCLEKKDFTKLRDWDLLAYPVNKLYKREILLENGIKFKIGLSECEDLVFNLQYIKKCERKIAVIPESLYHYEYREGSLSSRYHNDRFFDVIRPIFNTYESTIEETGVDDELFLKDFYSIYFLKIIENIPLLWDKRNTFNTFTKLIKAHKILMSREYKVCFEKMDKGRFNKLFLLVYGSRFLPLVLIFLRKYKK